jgi:hypothetical protein
MAHKEVLEHVAREHAVGARRRPPAEIVCQPAVHLDARPRERAHLSVRISGPVLAAADVVHELAEPGAEVDARWPTRHPALEEVLARHLPDGALRAALGGLSRVS